MPCGFKMTHEEFVKSISGINPNILIIGKYTKARERIACKCKVCNFE